MTGDESGGDRTRWDAIFTAEHYVYGKEPADFLKKNVEVLPIGRALDIAMGEGRNAVYLAKKGFHVDGVDFSQVALRKARRLARDYNVTINTINADLSRYQIKPNHYEVIVNINYLQRSLIPAIKKGVKKGGMVLFENHTLDQLKNEGGQGLRRDWLLKSGELKKAFSDFEILVYQETNDGKDALASLLARRRE